jgi:hypothetical protein
MPIGNNARPDETIISAKKLEDYAFLSSGRVILCSRKHCWRPRRRRSIEEHGAGVRIGGMARNSAVASHSQRQSTDID